MNNISEIKIIDSRESMIKLLPKNISIAELGVFKGDFSKILLNEVKPSKLFLVDIFSGIMGSGDKNGNNFEFINLDDQYESLKLYFSNNKEVELLKSRTSDFLSSQSDESLDAVYIDADHSYNAVKEDITLSFSKVKSGGYIMGHDFCKMKFPSVFKAVEDFCLEFNQKISMITNDGCPSFLIRKT